MTSVEAAEPATRPSAMPSVAARVAATGMAVAIGLRHSDNEALCLVLLSVTSVMWIVTDVKFGFEQKIEERGLPSREAWVPVLAVGIGLITGLVDAERAWDVFTTKLEIIVFILAFAVVARGLSHSGFFHYMAYRITERCRGNTTRLVLYLFILASVLTYLTSNDIVVLTLTPIILSICMQARIRNARLLLLSQFVAANTVSMGLLIGSPTNLIIGQELGINFFEYFFLMLVPTVVSFMLTFLMVEAATVLARREFGFFRRWHVRSNYAVPTFTHHSSLTREMRVWSTLFGVGVGLLALASLIGVSLHWASVPMIALAFYYGRLLPPTTASAAAGVTDGPAPAKQSATWLLQGLPYGIFFFGSAFFILADAFSATPFFLEDLVPWVDHLLMSENPFLTWFGTLVAGISVNIFNDLPAAALFAETLKSVTFANDIQNFVVLQAVLAGLNIGCYVTPVGALAGLIWFNSMRTEQRALRRVDDFDVDIPTPRDMVTFGLFVFLGVTVALGFVLVLIMGASDFLLAPTSGPSLMTFGPWQTLAEFIGLLFVVGSAIEVVRCLNRNGVVLGHMREVFAVLTRINVAALKHSVAYGILVAAIFLGGAAMLLFWVETAHSRIYEGVEARFESVKSFVVWLSVFIGSGFEQQLFPNSTLGIVLAGLLPLVTIGAVLFLARIPGRQSHNVLRRMLAKGSIPARRVVIVNYQPQADDALRFALERTGAFIMVFSPSANLSRAEALLSAENADRLFVEEQPGDLTLLIDAYCLLSVEWLFLLSDGQEEADLTNVRFLAEFDAALHFEFPDLRRAGADADHNGVDDDDLDDLATRLPKLLVEASSPRMLALIHRSLSEVLSSQVETITYAPQLAELLLADAAADLDALARYFRLQPGTTASHSGTHDILATGILGEPHHFEPATLAVESRLHLATLLDHLHQRDVLTPRRLHSSEMRLIMEEALESVETDDGSVRDTVDRLQLVGFEVAIGDHTAVLDVPSAALIAQGLTVHRALCLAQGVPSGEEPSSETRPVGRLILVNFNATCGEVLRRLPRGQQVLLVTPTAADLPAPIAGSDQVHIQIADTPDEIAVTLVDGWLPEPGAPKDRLRPGDHVYVFRSDLDAQPDLGVIRIAEAIDERLQDRLGEVDAVHPNDLLLVVESQDVSTRFLLEQLFVDKVVDSSWPRRAFLATMVAAWRAAEDATDSGQIEVTDPAVFHRITQLARWVSNLDVRPVSEVELDVNGRRHESLVGVAFGEAARSVRTASNPPAQLIGLLTWRFTRDLDGLTIDLVARPRTAETVTEDADLAIMLPLL